MKARKFFLAAMTVFAVVLFNSCEEEDPCKDVECGAYGICISGTCDCDAGYEGDSCQTVSRIKFLGIYSVHDSCTSSGIGTYSIEVDPSSVPADIDKVLVSNFWNLFVAPVRASVDENEITFSNQEPDGDGFWVSGSGTMTGNVINATYVIIDSTAVPVDYDTCFAVWTKI